MKQKLLFIAFLACFSGWGQGTETFESSNLTGSYLTGTFTGDNSVQWSYVGSRDQSTYGINNKGIMFEGATSAKITSGSVSGGIGSFTCNLKKAFTGAGNRQLELFINGVSKGVSIAWDNTTVQTFTVSNINVSGNISIEIKNKLNKQVVIDDISWTSFSVPTSTAYTTSWSNSAPTASIDAIIDGDLTTSADLICKDLTITANRTLTIGAGNKLTVSGNLINNGSIVFKSNATATALFDVFNGTQSGTGVATVERYIPAKRAFRFLSPSVTTTTTINQNWQENGSTTAGVGTHITGNNGVTNGFDATATNNPSLFSFNHTTALWEAVTNTNVNVLTAGTPYRLMVRGDRTTDLSSNTAATSTTTLRATGVLKTGSFSPILNQAAEGFSFIGNPYQAPVDIKAVLNAATNMNTGVAYYWDPTLNARGGYVTRNLLANTNDVTSNFTEFLQPGQAVFVKKLNTVSAASMTFIESNKAIANAAAGVFRNANITDYGLLRVNLQANTNNQWQTIEGTVALFNADFNPAITQEDATKMSNLDEEVSFVLNNTSLAIASQPNPAIPSELPIRLNNTRHTNYQWQFELDNYNGATPYLFDTVNNRYTQINNGTVVPFTTDANTTNRFKIVFQNTVLNNATFNKEFAIYPNPAKSGASFYIEGISDATVTVFNVVGQKVSVQIKSQGNTIQVTPDIALSTGVYLVNIASQGSSKQVKWIVE